MPTNQSRATELARPGQGTTEHRPKEILQNKSFVFLVCSNKYEIPQTAGTPQQLKENAHEI